MLKPIYGAILLIAGTSIGAGMLALPVSTAQLGFFPAASLMILSWYIMYLSALLLLEVSLCHESGANIISMSGNCFGIVGKVFAWTVYLLLLYVLTTAYLSAISDLLQDIVVSVFHIYLLQWVFVVTTICFFCSLLYLGTTLIDKVNRILMFGLVFSLCALVASFIGNTSQGDVFVYSWLGSEKALPILATSFGFHIIIPSLRSYLDSNVKDLKRAILIGSLIPLVIYLLWQFLVFSSLPTFGKSGFLQLWNNGEVTQLIDVLSASLHSSIFATVINIFSFFIISTSFLGVSLSLFDFLVDGLKLKNTQLSNFSILLLAFIPPLLLVLLNFKSFFIVLSYAGALVVLLLCTLPLGMAMVCRYRNASQPHIFVGSVGMFLVGFFSFIVLMFEYYAHF